MFSTEGELEEKWRLQATQSGTPAIQFELSALKLSPGLGGDLSGTVTRTVGFLLHRFSPVCVANSSTEIEAEQNRLSPTMRGRRGRPPKQAAVMREGSPGPVRGSRGSRSRGMRGRVRGRGRSRGRGGSGGVCGTGSAELDTEISGRENFHSSRGRRKVGASSTVAAAASRGRGGRGRGRGSRGSRGGRGGVRRPQTKVVYDDNSDEEDDNISYRSDDDELLNDNPSSDLEEEEALGNDSDYLEELPDDDDASYCTESSFRSHSTLGNTPGTFVCKCTHFSSAGLHYFKCAFYFLALYRKQGALFKMELALRNRPLFTVCSACLWFADLLHASTGSRVFDFLSDQHIFVVIL